MSKNKQTELRNAFLLKQINKVTESYLACDSLHQNRKHFVKMLEEALTNNDKRLFCGAYAMKLATKLGWKSPLLKGRPINNF